VSALALVVFAAGFVETIEVSRSLELGLRVVEAFECGPVVLELSVTNRGKKPLFISETNHDRYCLLKLPEAWNLERRSWPLGCPLRRFARLLDPGATFTERRVLHLDYRSAFPSGTEEVAVLWLVRAADEVPLRGSPRTLREPGREIARPMKSFPVTVTPATFTNRYALAVRLEAEYAALPPPSPVDAKWRSPFQVFCEKVRHAPHRELVPLLLRLVERVPVVDDWDMRTLRLELARTIFETDPAAAHRLFVDRLLTAPPQPQSAVAFEIWGSARYQLDNIVARMFIIANARFYFDRRYRPWEPLRDLVNLALWAEESAPHILPDAELKRLTGATDPAVRELVRKTFGNRLGRDR
jgi:hypothetical protein